MGGRGTFTAWLKGAAWRAELSLEQAAEGAYYSRRLGERLNGRRMRQAWERRTRRERGRSPLIAAEAKRFSQAGEDGVIAAIFDAIGTTNRTFLEIGSGDGSENCTRWLAEQGWGGVWVEAGSSAVELVRALGLGRVRIIGEPAAPRTLRQLLEGAALPDRLDLLVVDIDGNDWWVLGAALELLSPRVVVVKYNATFPPGSWWVMPYRAGFRWPGTFRQDASLDALCALARSKGLVLVGCGSNGVNAFFVDASAAGSTALVGSDPASCYVEPRIVPDLWAHPRSRPSAPRPTPELPKDELRRISMSVSLWPFRKRPHEPSEPVLFEVEVRNGNAVALTSVGRHAVQVALRWRDRDEGALWDGAKRVAIRHPVAPATARRMTFWQPAPERPGAYRLELLLVQENTMWLEHTLVMIEVTVERHV